MDEHTPASTSATRPLSENTAQDFTDEREQIGFREDAWLRSRGWKTTCDVPGAFWVWTREHEGRQLMAGKSLAMGMQGHIDDRERIKAEREAEMLRRESCVEAWREATLTPGAPESVALERKERSS